jgi:hypothetical protein
MLTLYIWGWPTHPLSTDIKRPWREGNHSSPSLTEVKNEWGYTSTHPVRLHVVQGNKFTLTFLEKA